MRSYKENIQNQLSSLMKFKLRVHYPCPVYNLGFSNSIIQCDWGSQSGSTKITVRHATLISRVRQTVTPILVKLIIIFVSHSLPSLDIQVLPKFPVQAEIPEPEMNGHDFGHEFVFESMSEEDSNSDTRFSGLRIRTRTRTWAES